MTLAYLVDTDWIIDHLNQRATVAQKLKEIRLAGIGVSIISLAELYEGVHHSKDLVASQQTLEVLIRQFEVLGVDEQVCWVFGRERGRLRQAGRTVSDFDLLIASSCLRWGLTLLSNNRRHFEAVEGLCILSVP